MCDAFEPPKRLVLLATGMEIPVCPFGWFGRLQSSYRFEGHSVQARVTCPVVVANGSEDQAMPIQGAQELAKIFGARMLTFAGRTHVDLWPDVRRELLGK